MAGEWIKMRASLCTNPRVLRMAELVGNIPDAASVLIVPSVHATGKQDGVTRYPVLRDFVTPAVLRDIVIGALLRVWDATNQHTHDGVWENSTLETLDIVAGLPGFGHAMEQVGWASVDAEGGAVLLSNFGEHNVPSRKRVAQGQGQPGEGAVDGRSANARRQAAYRERERERKRLQEERNGLSGDSTNNASRNASSNASDGHNGNADGDATDLARREEKNRGTPDRDSGAGEHAVTSAAEVCKALKTVGFPPATINQAHPVFAELIKAGATVEEFTSAAKAAEGKGGGFAYLLTVVANRRTEAARVAQGLVRGPLPAAPKSDRRHAGYEARDYREGVDHDGAIK